jgi:hypothetical protein
MRLPPQRWTCGFDTEILYPKKQLEDTITKSWGISDSPTLSVPMTLFAF